MVIVPPTEITLCVCVCLCLRKPCLRFFQRPQTLWFSFWLPFQTTILLGYQLLKPHPNFRAKPMYCLHGCGSKSSHQPQVLVLGSIYQGKPFWGYPITHVPTWTCQVGLGGFPGAPHGLATRLMEHLPGGRRLLAEAAGGLGAVAVDEARGGGARGAGGRGAGRRAQRTLQVRSDGDPRPFGEPPVGFPRISSPFFWSFLVSLCFPLTRQKSYFFAGALVPAKLGV